MSKIEKLFNSKVCVIKKESMNCELHSTEVAYDDAPNDVLHKRYVNKVADFHYLLLAEQEEIGEKMWELKEWTWVKGSPAN
jgi:hypothetical protein